MAIMPVNSTHPEFDAHAAAWSRARDVLAGEDAVKAGGERYLPRLDSQSEADYTAYRQRASFFNASARTADGFVGLLFRREPTVRVPQEPAGVAHALNQFLGDADLLGTSFNAYAKTIAAEVIAVGRAGTLVDWEDEAEHRAFAVRYHAEQILNWRTERVQGRNVLTLVVLKETYTSPRPSVQAGPATMSGEGDEFELAEREQLRVLRLVRDDAPHPVKPGAESRPTSWRYVVELWQWREERLTRLLGLRAPRRWVLVATRTPRRFGRSLPWIPFVFHGPRHSLPAVDKMPLADIIAVNLDHYRLSADYRHGLHFTALPTAWVAGFPKNVTLEIGSRTAWVAAEPDARAGFLEFRGEGLATFERAMDRDERLMAVLGTRLLEAQKRVGETAEAIELRQSGETSVLTAISLSVSHSLTQVLRWVYWWHSTETNPDDPGADRVLMQLNQDFSTKGMSSEDLRAVVGAWQAGAISRETMLDLFRQGEVLPPGRSDQEERQLVAAGQQPETPRQVTEHPLSLPSPPH